MVCAEGSEQTRAPVVRAATECGNSSSGVRFLRFRGLLECGNACINVLDFDGLGRVIEDRLCGAHLDRCRRGRIDERLQQSGGGRRRSLLEPRDGLSEGGPARLSISLLKLWLLLPAHKCLGRDSDGSGRPVEVTLREQRRDGVFHLSPELRAVAGHLRPPGDTCAPLAPVPSGCRTIGNLATKRSSSSWLSSGLSPLR